MIHSRTFRANPFAYLSTIAVAITTILFCAPIEADAQTLTYLGSSTNKSQAISARLTATLFAPGVVDFVLTNTSSISGQTNKQNVLSGFFFDYTSRQTASLTGVTVGTALNNSQVLLSSNGSVVNETNINGSFVFKDVRTVTNTAFAFGVNSSGYSSTTNPNYSFSGFSKGTGNDDYTLISSTSSTVNGNGFNVIRNSVTLRVSGLKIQTGATTANLDSIYKLSGVSFAFASGEIVDATSSLNGKYNTVNGILQPVPAPAAGVSLGIGCLVGVFSTGVSKVQSRRRKLLANKA